jgi:DNA-binding CsgD family transcriptional regulator
MRWSRSSVADNTDEREGGGRAFGFGFSTTKTLTTWFITHSTGGIMQAAELTRLHQLCRLDMPGALLPSALFEELKNVIPCSAMTLLWRPSVSSTVRVFHESETELTCGHLDAESFGQTLFAPHSEPSSLLEPAHPMFKEIARRVPSIALLVEHDLSTVVAYFTDSGTRSGAILLHRLGTERFSTTETALLVRLAPILSAALNVNTDRPQFTTSELHSGMLLLDKHLEIQYACPRGRKLIQLCKAADIDGWDIKGGFDLQNMLRTHFGLENITPSPNFEFTNFWGSFHFRLLRLSCFELNADQVFAVAAHCREPLVLRVFRRCKTLALTEKQTEISLSLIKGLSYEAIATKLWISPNTVVDHVRKLYERIGASNRSELVTALLLGTEMEPVSPQGGLSLASMGSKRTPRAAITARCL